MSKTAKELFEEKMALVYSYNHASPLFIRAASSALKKNDPHEALDILNQGIKNFPKYPTAYVLLGKVHLELGNFDLAENAFRKGCDFVGSAASLSFYLSELENSKSRHPNIQQSRRVSFFEHNSIQDTKDNKEIISPVAKNPDGSSDLQGLSIDDRLEDVAKKISFAKINISNENIEPAIPSAKEKKSDNTPIISETLAKIYISQGKFHEAIEVYKKLQIKSPDKKEFYQLKIDEIQKQISDSDWL